MSFYDQSSFEDLPPGKQRAIAQLQRVAAALDKSPSIREYRSNGYSPSASTITELFGGWDAAKQRADLEPLSGGATQQHTINSNVFKPPFDNHAAYLLGTLYKRGAIHTNDNGNPTYRIGRCEDTKWFLDQFRTATDCTYPLHINDSAPNTLHVLSIGDEQFISALEETGAPDPETDFPGFDHPQSIAFLRGFLESNGYFSTTGWSIRLENHQRADTIVDWFDGFGVSVSPTPIDDSNHVAINITSPYTIRDIYENVWVTPDISVPQYRAYTDKIESYLRDQHPFADSIDYL